MTDEQGLQYLIWTTPSWHYSKSGVVLQNGKSKRKILKKHTTARGFLELKAAMTHARDCKIPYRLIKQQVVAPNEMRRAITA